jgi:hypothetical protein
MHSCLLLLRLPIPSLTEFRFLPAHEMALQCHGARAPSIDEVLSEVTFAVT